MVIGDRPGDSVTTQANMKGCACYSRIILTVLIEHVINVDNLLRGGLSLQWSAHGEYTDQLSQTCGVYACTYTLLA